MVRAGLSLRIEKSSLSQVQERIAYWKRKKEQGGEEDYDLQARVEKAIQEEEDAKARRKEREKEKKKLKKEQDAEAMKEFEDDEVAAMMGFGGFKSKNA